MVPTNHASLEGGDSTLSIDRTLISVCIPTYRRPGLLGRLLESLVVQDSGDFSYDVVVVDNDPGKSAQGVAAKYRELLPVPLTYVAEPVPNISLARNRAIASSTGALIAFIDDDEYPGKAWLQNLYVVFKGYEARGVLGPVVPQYSGKPPRWLVRSGLAERPTFPTGTILTNTLHMRTGNVLLDRGLVPPGELAFDPAYGHSGGEDVDFFRRMLVRGYRFVWSNEAWVYEEVPPDRQKRSFYTLLALRRGVTNAKISRTVSWSTAKSIAALMVYPVGMALAIVVGQWLFMRVLVSFCSHLGKILTHMGIRLSVDRSITPLPRRIHKSD